MNPDKLIEASWKLFEEKVIPKTAGKEQRADMFAAFFAGAVTVVEAIDMAVEQSPVLGVTVMESLKRETDDFISTMGKEIKWQ